MAALIRGVQWRAVGYSDDARLLHESLAADEPVLRRVMGTAVVATRGVPPPEVPRGVRSEEPRGAADEAMLRGVSGSAAAATAARGVRSEQPSKVAADEVLLRAELAAPERPAAAVLKL